MLMPHEAKDSKADKDCSDRVADRRKWQRHTEKRCGQHYAADACRVADGNRDERSRYGTPLLLLHPERYREEPPHCRIDSMPGAEEQHHPEDSRSEPRNGHCLSEKQYESDEASPPSSRTWCALNPSNSTKNFSSSFIPPFESTSSFAIQLFNPSG